MSEHWNANKTKTSFIAGFLVILLFFLSIISISAVPPTSRDALTHHLAIPSLYLKHGGIYEIPDKVFSYYPMNLDLLYLVPLYFGNDIVPKFIHFAFGLLTAWITYLYLKRRIGQNYALGGALFFLSIPIIVKLSISVYVDLGLIFFTTAALLLLLKWRDNIEKPTHLFLSAACCGLAMGTKYNGLVAFVILSAFVPFVYMHQEAGSKGAGYKAAGYALAYAFIALVAFSPWMVRNFIWTGNPIYPLYDHWFNPGAGAGETAFGIFTTRAIRYHESWWEMVLLPVRIFFQGQDGNPRYFDGKLNPFLFILPVFAFFRSGHGASGIAFEKKILIAFAVLFFAFAFFSTGLRIRYILPIVPPLVILSVYGVRNILQWGRGAAHRKTKYLVTAVSLVIFYALFLNAAYICQQFKIVRPLEYLSGKITRDEYITRYRSEYPAMQYINKNLPEGAKILLFYLGHRGYYCNREYVFDMAAYKSTLHQMVKQAKDAGAVYRKLREKGVTHFLIRNDIFNRWISADFSKREKGILKIFFQKHVVRLFNKNGYGVFRLSG